MVLEVGEMWAVVVDLVVWVVTSGPPVLSSSSLSRGQNRIPPQQLQI